MRYTPKTTTPATVFGAREAGNFSIAVNGKMFNVLIDGLYTNKIESIVREACANARDGHLKRGNVDTPFLVHVPSTLEPWFSVRDYGCSMDHEMVMKLYTTLGWSSKEDSDTMVGCFGLGSKAPFAYAETFSVTTYLDGMKRVYVCFMDDDDQPKIILSDEMESDDETGVEVSIPVKEDAFSLFRRAIRRTVLGYEVPFLAPGVDLPKIEYVSRSEAFDVVRREGNYGYGSLVSDVLPNGPYARIGVVLYPIDHANETFRAALEDRDPALRTFISTATTGDLIINIPIAVAAVTPSREFLSYTKGMINVIVDVYEEMCKKLRAEVIELYEGCTTKWEYATRYRKISQNKRDLSSYAENNYAKHQTEWGPVSRLLRCALPGYHYNHPLRTAGLFSGGDNSLQRTNDGDRGNKTILVIGHVDRVPTHAPTRVSQYEKLHGYTDSILVRFFDIPTMMKRRKAEYDSRNPKAGRTERKTNLQAYYDSLVSYRKALDQFVMEFECPNVVNEWDLPYAKEERITQNFQMFTVYDLESSGNVTEARYRSIEGWKTVKAVVVPLTKRNYDNWRGSTGFTQKMLSLGGIDCDVVIGVSMSNLPDMRKHFPNWIMFDDALAKIDLSKIQAAFDTIYLCERFSELAHTTRDAGDILKMIINPSDGYWYSLPPEVEIDVRKFLASVDLLGKTVTSLRKSRDALQVYVGDHDAKNFVEMIQLHGLNGLTVVQSGNVYADILNTVLEFREMYPEIDMICGQSSRYEIHTGMWGLIISSYLTGRKNTFRAEFDPNPAPEPTETDEPSVEIPCVSVP